VTPNFRNPVTQGMSRNPIAEKVVVEPPGFSVVVPSLIVTAVLSLTVGYWLGKGDSLRYFSKPRKSLPKLGSPGKDFEIPAGQAGEAIDDECKLVSPNVFSIDCSGLGSSNRSRDGKRQGCTFQRFFFF